MKLYRQAYGAFSIKNNQYIQTRSLILLLVVLLIIFPILIYYYKGSNLSIKDTHTYLFAVSPSASRIGKAGRLP